MYKKFMAGILALTLTIGGTVLPACAQADINVAVVSSAAQASADGYEYEVLADGGVEITSYTGSASDVTIPSTIDGKNVVSVGDRAFRNSSITSVTIPDTVTQMGIYVFYNCTSLKKVTFSKNLSVIGEGAFSSCTGLESITIPGTVKTIDECAFEDCTSLSNVTISDGVAEIKKEAFSGCEKIGYMNVPDSVEYVGENAFKDTSWFKYHGDGLFYVGKVAYKYIGTMSENTTIQLNEGTTMVGYSAFEGCSLAGVTIPSSVKYIGDSAFKGTSLSEVTVPDSVETLGKYAFQNCKNLNKAVLPKNLNSLSFGLFSGCVSLESIEVPSSVELIDMQAFNGCTKLSSVKLPSGLKTIRASAFANCSGLVNIDIPSTVTELGSSVFAKTGLKSIVIPDGVAEIPSSMCLDSTSLSSVKLSKNATKIGSTAFDNTAISSIEIPDTVTSIGDRAFYMCPNMKSVTVPASVNSIGKRAIGFDYDTSTRTESKVNGFTLYCYEGSGAETYAKWEGVNYELLAAPVVKDVANCTVTLREAAEFTGLSIKPTVKVKDGTTTLKNGRDYTVTYSDNKQVGTATVTITGKGDYTGTTVKTFKIIKKSVETCDVTLSKTRASFNNTYIKPDVTVRIGDEVINSRNYDVKYSNNFNVGKATVTITGKNNLKGKVTKTFRIAARSLSKCKISLSGTSFKYTGSEIKPKVTVGVTGSDKAVSSSNYTVKYSNNVKKGTATVTITGKGNLKDTVTKTFTIK